MKLIIRNHENISLSESLGLAYEFIGNLGLNEIIEDCKLHQDGLGTVYVFLEYFSRIVYWAKLNKNSLTINVRREYDKEAGQ